MAGRLALVFLDEFRGIANGRDLLGCIVGNFDAEFFFESHHKLDDVEAVCAKIIDEACILSDLVTFDAEMFDDNFLHAVGSIAHVYPS
ncbi:acyl carrier protein [Erythrobacter sp. NAP1]|nr:acyl carrier protein [Erythrobacter sp. NAP1]